MGGAHAPQQRVPNSSGSFIPDKVELLWMKNRVPMYSKVSYNVLREIASYLEGSGMTIAVHKHYVQCFDIREKKWRRMLTMRKEISIGSFPTSVLLGREEVFVCEMHYPTYILEGDHSIHPYSEMRLQRVNFGIVYDPATAAVYIFGGIHPKADATTELRECEKFQLSSCTWVSIASMHEARWYFNPCLCFSIIYLCGGFRTSVEMYDQRTNMFTIIPNFVLPERNHSIAVVDIGNLVVLTPNSMLWWNLEQKRVTEIRQRSSTLVASQCPPIVNAGVVYLTFSKICEGYNLITGVMEIRVADSS